MAVFQLQLRLLGSWGVGGPGPRQKSGVQSPASPSGAGDQPGDILNPSGLNFPVHKVGSTLGPPPGHGDPVSDMSQAAGARAGSCALGQ